MKMKSVMFAVASVALVACGGSPVATSQPINLSKTADSSKVASGVLTLDQGINNDQGSPYMDFLGSARQQLDGKDPSRIELDSASLFLGGQSQGVTGLEQVFSDKVEMLFDTGNATYVAAHADSVSGSGPAGMSVDFDWSKVAPADQTALLNGSFKVVLRGNATPTFANSTAKAELQSTLTFKAY